MGASILLMAFAWLGQAAAPADEALKLDVRRLVRQLDAAQLAQRDAAEAALVKLGPNILDLLPAATERASAEVQQRLGRVRQQLQRSAAEAAVQPAKITLHAQAMPLSEVLRSLQAQSGNKIVDARAESGQEASDLKLTLDFQQTPFWEALDRALDQAGLTVYGYGEDRAIQVVARREGQLARSQGGVCYSGPFRFEPVRLIAQRELRQSGADSLRLVLAVSWEPRLKPIGLTQRMADLSAVDERGNPLAFGGGPSEIGVPAGNSTSVELILPMQLPPRDVRQIASLRGKLLAMVPGKVETFAFGDLLGAKNVQQRMAGVTVTLEQVRQNNALWEVRVRVRFDQAGDALASHRNWIFNNEARLEGPDGKPVPYDAMETTLQTANEVGVAYLFALDGRPDKHKFIYKTPGVIVATEFPYELTKLDLP